MRHPRSGGNRRPRYGAAVSDLPLTGERTVPGLPRENYWFRRHEAAYEWVRRSLPIKGAVVVDAGSGEGYGAELLREGGAARVIGLEYDPPAAAHARRHYPGVTTVRANLAALPLPTGSAGVVVSMQVIEHLWDLPAFLADCCRVLQPGGWLVVTTPNRLTFSPGLDRGEKPTNPFHVEEFDAGQIQAMLRGAGFLDIEVLGLRHTEAVAGDIVERQVAAVLADEWPADLVSEVAAVAVADFVIDGDHRDDWLDLVGIARAPYRE